MAQECGFFNAKLVGEELDRVYLAEQFAAYFASFIGNGIYGKSMQKLEVASKDVPNMSVQVLSGEAWINGWWYRNSDAYTLRLQIADGILSRIDAIVLRWGNSERDMWLHVITGEPSSNPKIPKLRRDADYYDLMLAYVSVPAGTIKVTQAQITDTRLDNSVCGLVTGVVKQIDTTDLYNQFTAYFNEFKYVKEVDFNNWTEEQKQAYLDFTSSRQDAYDKWTAEKMLQWVEWVESFKEFIESLENGEVLLRVEMMLDNIFRIATDADIDAIIAGTYIEKSEQGLLIDIASDAEIDAIIAGTYEESEEEEDIFGDDIDDKLNEIVDNAFTNQSKELMING